MKKYALLILLPLLFACEDRYRYPCQDPDNWEQKQCKKPYCQANGTCPEDLFKYTADGQQPAPAGNNQAFTLPPGTTPPAPTTPKKGDCK